MNNIQCITCGVEFIQNSNSQKTCSNNCRKKYYKLQKKKAYEIDKEYIKLRNKRYRTKNIERTKKMWINYYYKNQDKILSDAKQRRLKNIDKFKLKDKLYNINNKDKIKIRRDKNRERDRKRDIEYYNKNRPIILEKHRIFNSLNKEKLAKYKRERKQRDINFKLRQNLSSMVSNSLKKFLIGKEYNNLYTIELTGCSMEKLKQHLEKQFKPGMNWDNWTVFGWHIDHIKPRSLFNLLDPEEQRKCFHYTNLQPLWAEENLKKGDRYNE